MRAFLAQCAAALTFSSWGGGGRNCAQAVVPTSRAARGENRLSIGVATSRLVETDVVDREVELELLLHRELQAGDGLGVEVGLQAEAFLLEIGEGHLVGLPVAAELDRRGVAVLAILALRGHRRRLAAAAVGLGDG